MARPSKYDPKINKQVEKLCILGATDVEISDFFSIDVATLNRWKIKYPPFCASIKRGKMVADANVAESLYKRATGYSHKSVKIFNADGNPLIVPFTEKFAPDVIACIFWLKNRRSKVDPTQGQAWKDKHDVTFEKHTDEELEAMVNMLREKIK